MQELQNMCRTCGTVSENIALTSLFPTENSERSIPLEISRIIDILELNFQKGDGLPGSICNDCLQTLAAVCEFRNRCYDMQKIFVRYIITRKSETTTSQHTDLVDSKVEMIYKTESPDIQSSTDNFKDEVSVNALRIEEFTDSDSLSKTVQCIDWSDLCNDKEITELADFGFVEDNAFLLNDDTDNSEVNEDLDSNDKWNCEYAIVSDEETNLDDTEPPVKRRNIRRASADEPDSIPNEKCQFCGKMYRRVKLHLPKCSKRNVELCELCPLHFATTELLEVHMKEMHPDGLFTCGICSSTFGSKNERKAHTYKIHSKKERVCKDCKEIFQDRNALRMHRLKEHIDIINKECPHCKQMYKTQYEYDNHVKKHTAEKRYQCRFCGRGFMQNQHRHHHELTHTGERPFLCEVCGKSFFNNTYLQIHLASSHNYDVKKSYTHTKKVPYTCDQCGSTLGSYSALKIHIGKHQGLYKKKSKATGLPLACTQCPKRFANLSSLENHTKTHLEKRDFVCQECGCGFKRMSHLNGHVRRMHLKEKNHICPYCSKAFAENFELTEHMYIHKEERNYKCKFCPRAFKMRSSLKNHVRGHTNEKPFECYICGMHFKTSVMQQAHRSKHTEQEVEVAKQKILMDLEYSKSQMEKEQQMSNLIDSLGENIVDISTMDTSGINLDDDSIAIYKIEMLLE